VEHDRLGVGVVEEIQDLLGPVPVVRVDRRHPRLERRVVRLEVLGAVVEVGGDLRLPSEPGGDQVGGERVRAPVEVAPGHDPIALYLSRRIG
jgi:hypothetical protein